MLNKAQKISSSNGEIASCSNCDVNRASHITKILEGPQPMNLPNPSMKNTSAQDLVVSITFVHEREETDALNLGQPHHLLHSDEVQEI